ncbi:MAG: hypothetical protein ACO3S8_07095, partial [Aquiluna sp.]
MSESLWLTALAIVMAAALGFVGGWLMKTRRGGSSGDHTALQAQLDMAQRQYEDLRTKHAAENKILQALTPVSERLTDMQRTVAELEK